MPEVNLKSLKEHFRKWFLVYLAISAAIALLLVLSNSQISILHFIPILFTVLAIDEFGGITNAATRYENNG